MRFEQLLADVAPLGMKRFVIWCKLALSEIYIATGNIEGADQFLNDVIDECRRSNYRLQELYALLDKGYLHHLKGDYAAAKQAYIRSISELECSKDISKRVLAQLRLADVEIETGDYESALERATTAANEIDSPARLCHAKRTAALAAAYLGQVDTATKCIQESINLSAKASDIDRAMCHRCASRCYRLLNDEARSESNRDAALVLFEQIGASFYASSVRESMPNTGPERERTTVASPLDTGETREGRGDVQAIMDSALHRLLEVTGAQRVLLLLSDKLETYNEATSATNIPHREAIDLSKTVAERCLESARQIVTHDAPNDSRFEASESIVQQDIRSVVVTPLISRNGTALGCIYMDHKGLEAFSPKDITFVSAYAEFVGIALERALDYRALERDLEELGDSRSSLGSLIGRSPKMQKIYSLIEKVAPSDISVLIQGETGTGKGLVARTIHSLSRRKGGPFLHQNCGALPSHLLESELFGHAKGSFTSASSDRKGLFEAADGGTVFLDEIGDAPPEVQVRLLHILEEGAYRRVGESTERTVDVRVIAATNRELSEEVSEGNFREDLYYRLKVLSLFVPPLRERPEDIQMLANHFLEVCKEKASKDIRGFQPKVMQALTQWKWPGNIRELENEIEKGVTLAQDGGQITLDLMSADLCASVDSGKSVDEGGTLKDRVQEYERRVISKLLDTNGWNVTRTAKELGISRVGLQGKLKRLGISRPD